MAAAAAAAAASTKAVAASMAASNVIPAKALIKMLASSSKKARETGLQTLLSWLPQQDHISPTDLKNIWKGLFYSLWHADHPPFQSNLINKVCSLLLDLPRTLAPLYSSLFFLTMHREWGGIDLLRLDKFYLFIRVFLRHLLLFLHNSRWDVPLCRLLMLDLEEGMFNYSGRVHANGVNYYVASVFLEELRGFLPLDVCVLEVLFGPFVAAVCRSEDRVLVEKAKVGVFDVLVRGGEAGLGTVVSHMSFSDRFYALGSSLECSDCNRRVVLRLHEEFVEAERGLKEVGEGGVGCFGGGLLRDEMEVEEEEEEEEKEEDVSRSEVEQGLKEKRKKKRKGKCRKKKRQAEEMTRPESEPKMRKKAKKSEVESVDIIPEKGLKESSDVVAEERGIEFSDDFISNLEAEFERAAAEENQRLTLANGHIPEKGKRTKRHKNRPKPPAQVETGGRGADEGSLEAKKVTFAMKKNMVWKPNMPLPPQSLRIPPSLTPRGSALKKGALPGPIAPVNPGGRVRLDFKNKKMMKTMKKMKKMKRSIVIISPSFKAMKMV